MNTFNYGGRKASPPLRPEFWLELQPEPLSVSPAETAEAHSAYSEVARDCPKVISLTNRIGVIGKLQTVATVLALRISRERDIPDARTLVRLYGMYSRMLGPLPISIITPETVAVVDDALDGVLPDGVAALILSDLLRLIEGVRP